MDNNILELWLIGFSISGFFVLYWLFNLNNPDEKIAQASKVSSELAVSEVGKNQQEPCMELSDKENEPSI